MKLGKDKVNTQFAEIREDVRNVTIILFGLKRRIEELEQEIQGQRELVLELRKELDNE